MKIIYCTWEVQTWKRFTNLRRKWENRIHILEKEVMRSGGEGIRMRVVSYGSFGTSCVETWKPSATDLL